MLLGVLFARKRYSLAKYLFVMMIVLGCAAFMYKGDKKSKALDADHTIGFGELLLVSGWGGATD
jgi:UDP-galactose transporter B1